MYVDILIHVYVDSGHLSLKTTPTHVGNEHGNVVNKLVSLTRLTFPWDTCRTSYIINESKNT